jgi:hypothetical protein
MISEWQKQSNVRKAFAAPSVQVAELRTLFFFYFCMDSKKSSAQMNQIYRRSSKGMVMDGGSLLYVAGRLKAPLNNAHSQG